MNCEKSLVLVVPWFWGNSEFQKNPQLVMPISDADSLNGINNFCDMNTMNNNIRVRSLSSSSSKAKEPRSLAWQVPTRNVYSELIRAWRVCVCVCVCECVCDGCCGSRAKVWLCTHHNESVDLYISPTFNLCATCV